MRDLEFAHWWTDSHLLNSSILFSSQYPILWLFSYMYGDKLEAVDIPLSMMLCCQRSSSEIQYGFYLKQNLACILKKIVIFKMH